MRWFGPKLNALWKFCSKCVATLFMTLLNTPRRMITTLVLWVLWRSKYEYSAVCKKKQFYTNHTFLNCRKKLKNCWIALLWKTFCMHELEIAFDHQPNTVIFIFVLPEQEENITAQGEDWRKHIDNSSEAGWLIDCGELDKLKQEMSPYFRNKGTGFKIWS